MDIESSFIGETDRKSAVRQIETDLPSHVEFLRKRAPGFKIETRRKKPKGRGRPKEPTNTNQYFSSDFLNPDWIIE
jgi:hypothetical protein